MLYYFIFLYNLFIVLDQNQEENLLVMDIVHLIEKKKVVVVHQKMI